MCRKIILIILASYSVFADFSCSLLDEIGQLKTVDTFNTFGKTSSGTYCYIVPKFVELCGSADKALMSFAPHAVVDKNGDFYAINLYGFNDQGPKIQITKIDTHGFYPWISICNR